ncbi:hypothetical protein GCM10009809_31320 [Isoptericola hypogeus]|uniref:Uncharacterized protein n=1 Tax=Isoptericola hypogeus TaxID=300179 RepID=A0ABN2JNU8_9MICO
MLLTTSLTGAGTPFERDREVVLRRLPVGSVLRRATATITPVAADDDRRFLETVAFTGATGSWGAGKVVAGGAVEVDLHARRRLAGLVGTGLADGRLLVDLGGGFLAVNEDGGLGPGDPFELAADASGSVPVPGIAVAGLRVADATDLSEVRVASPPSNVALALAGGPTLFAHVGDLVEPVTTPDLAPVLQALMAQLPVEHGVHVLRCVLHSDSIARLDVALDLEVEHVASATPPGVGAVQARYAYGGRPEQGALSVAVPPGLVAVGSAGRARGAFDESRVVLGPVTTPPAPALVEVAGGGGLAQPFVPVAPVIATSIDLLLTAVTATAVLAVDVVDDLDGKPGRRSALPRPAETRLTRDSAGTPTWVSLPLGGELEADAGVRRWVVLQVRDGTAAWSAGPGGAASGGATDGVPPAPDVVGLQRTRDGGLSWRAEGPGAHAAPFRLRSTPPVFTLPVDLRTTVAETETVVDLQRFAASGTVDVDLAMPELADAVNQTLSVAGAGGPTGELVANGDFADWLRVGSELGFGGTVGPLDGGALVAAGFATDATVVHGLVDVPATEEAPDGGVRYGRFDVLRGAALGGVALGPGTARGIAVDQAGRLVLAAVAPTASFETGSAARTGRLVLVDAQDDRVVGTPVVPPLDVRELVAAPDGSGVYLAGDAGDEDDEATVRFVGWDAWRAATGPAGTPVPWERLPQASVRGRAHRLAVGPDGAVGLLVHRPDEDAGGEGLTDHLVVFADRDALATRHGREVEVPRARALAFAPAAATGPPHVLVLCRESVRFLRASDLVLLDEVALPTSQAEDLDTGRGIAVDAAGELAVVVLDRGTAVLDVRRRRITRGGVGVGAEDPTTVALSPPALHAVVATRGAGGGRVLTFGPAVPEDWEVTAGGARPTRLDTGGVVAVLGDLAVGRGRRDVGRARGPAAIAQVLPAVGGLRYRFAFDGLTDTEGATAQVRWRGQGCEPERVDRVPIAVFDPDVRDEVAVLPHHEATLVAPAGAVQAEVAFSTPDGVAAVGAASLASTAQAALGPWEAPDPAAGVVAHGSVTRLSNTGAVPSRVSRVLAVTPGDVLSLEVDARVDGESGAVVEVAFAGEPAGSGALPVPVGEAFRLPLDPFDFDDRLATATVPDGAVEAVLTVVLPPSTSVDVRALSLRVAAPVEVGIAFASQAPGELRLTDVTVRFERASERPAPLPAGGLCPPTPVGSGDGSGAYCSACGCSEPARATTAATGAGRAVAVSACPSCGARRLRHGGAVAQAARPVALPRLHVTAVPGRDATAAVRTVVRVDVRPIDLDGIGPVRARELAARGLADLVALARADVADVASLPGVSVAMAAGFVAEAARLVAERGRRTLSFEAPGAERPAPR